MELMKVNLTAPFVLIVFPSVKFVWFIFVCFRTLTVLYAPEKPITPYGG